MNYCTSCFRNAIYYGEIFPDHDFIKWGETDDNMHYSIVQDHAEIYRFKEKPIYINPTANAVTEEEENEMYKDKTICEMDDIYCKKVHEMDFMFHPQIGWDICENAKKAGWNPEKNGWLEYWVMHRAATMLREKETL